MKTVKGNDKSRLRERWRRFDAAGFTLIELIVAFTIFSLIAVLIGGVIQMGMDYWEKGEAETEETQRLRVLVGLMSQQIKSAFPYNVEVESEEVLLFKGEGNSLLFATAFADKSFGGFKWVRYSFRDGALLYKEGILPDKEFMDKIDRDEEVIDPEAGKVEFSYFSDEKDDWTDTWGFNKKIPSSVRVRISYFQPFRITLPLARNIEKGVAESGSG